MNKIKQKKKHTLRCSHCSLGRFFVGGVKTENNRAVTGFFPRWANVKQFVADNIILSLLLLLRLLLLKYYIERESRYGGCKTKQTKKK